MLQVILILPIKVKSCHNIVNHYTLVDRHVFLKTNQILVLLTERGSAKMMFCTAKITGHLFLRPLTQRYDIYNLSWTSYHFRKIIAALMSSALLVL